MSESLISPEIRAVFFDAVGTLIDPDPSAVAVYRAAGVRRSINLDRATIAERFRAALRSEEDADIRVGLQVSEERERQRWRSIVAAVFAGRPEAEELFAELWDYFARPAAWRVAPEAGDVLRDLAGRGLTLGIASNFDRRLHTILDGLADLASLRHRVVSSQVGWRKPSLQFFAAMIAAAGVAPDQIVYVGDRLDVDYQGANAAGLRGVLYDPVHGVTTDVRRIRRMSELVR